MDPVTALGVAAAAVQFIDFGLKTLALCKQIRDSDADTTLLHAELQQSTKQLERIQKGVTLDIFPRDTSRSIKQCSQDCSSAAEELRVLLADIRTIAQKKRFGAARAAFRALMDQKKIEKLQNKLEKCQERFHTAVSVDTREQVLQLLQGQGRISRTLESLVYPELKQMHKATQGQIAAFQTSSGAAHEVTHKGLADLTMTTKASRKAIESVEVQVKTRFDHVHSSSVRRIFLQSLEYPNMFSRYRNIDQPAIGTFEWILTRDSSHKDLDSRIVELRGRFSTWLRGPHPIFWINGKAGSGKSSLMSFIEGHERTRTLLKIWAGGRQLHIFSFFFWRPGSELQKSILGLLQSLLYQLAQAKPAIIGNLLISNQSVPGCVWTEARLVRAIEKALSLYADERIFLLIDGLDEFEGRYTALVDLLLRLQEGSGAKFCLSSRPETALTRRLGSFPSLRLQDLNFQDIKTFVHREFTAYDYNFGDPRDLQNLVSEVAHRAEGIFLWAVLVCNSLASGYEAGDDAKMLKQRLDAIPSGLETLFTYMFSTIDKEHREYLSRCFFLLKWSKESGSDIPLPLITAFMWNHPPSSLDEFRKDCDVVGHRVVAQGKGLLEWRDPPMSMFSRSWEHLRPLTLWVLKDVSAGNDRCCAVKKFDYSLAEDYKVPNLEWVHRSAYDCILGPSRDKDNSWVDSMNEHKLLRDLLDAKLWLACYLPGQHMNPSNGPTASLACLIKPRGDTMMQETYQALDELYETIQISCYGEHRVELVDSLQKGSESFHLCEGAEPLRAFWNNIASHSLGGYILRCFDNIKNSVYADLICSGLVHNLGRRFNTVNVHMQYLVPALNLSAYFLIMQEPMGSSITAARTPDDYSGGHDGFPERCYSWIGSGRVRERRLVCDIASGLEFFEDGSDRDAVADVRRQLQRLSDLWQIQWGRGPGFSRPHFLLSIHISQRIVNWSYERGGPTHETASDESLLNWRFICFDYHHTYSCQHSAGSYFSILASFDVKAQSNRELMKRFGRVFLANAFYFKGTPEEEARCLESIFEEVWADSEGQLRDGWHQLYLLACLKKYFGVYWEV